MKRRQDEIDPVKYPQLFYLLWYKVGVITPEEALETYTTQWRFVNYEMMSNHERMLLIELIDELSDGIFEPFFDASSCTTTYWAIRGGKRIAFAAPSTGFLQAKSR